MTRQKKTAKVRCNQCEALMINGVFCHERECPNERKTWDAERSDWVLYLDCRYCGCEVECGTYCGCYVETGAELEPEELETE
jgi:hypothetical protein